MSSTTTPPPPPHEQRRRATDVPGGQPHHSQVAEWANLMMTRTHPAEVRTADAVPADPAAAAGLWVHARVSEAVKCVRCWQKRADVGSDPVHPELCARCAVNVDGAGETRRFA